MRHPRPGREKIRTLCFGGTRVCARKWRGRGGVFNKGLSPQRRVGHQGTAVTAESSVEEEGANSEVLRVGRERERFGSGGKAVASLKTKSVSS